KEKYGNDLTLWTGVQCETLIQGSQSEVEKEVLKNLDLLMPGGGYIFGSTNSVQFGAKTENYLRALELVREKGIY
ncbi:MAG TPA: nucleoside 2-deoxyribosyltransferase, partial [Candidatus Pelethocola excrementipullorum]|nr:nucleoside 2-deoxyribosyltransferase [Candidatus Pelethocola excrementipullorum]